MARRAAGLAGGAVALGASLALCAPQLAAAGEQDVEPARVEIRASSERLGLSVAEVRMPADAPVRFELVVSESTDPFAHALVLVPARYAGATGWAVSTPGSPEFGRIPREDPVLGAMALTGSGARAHLDTTLPAGEYALLCAVPQHHHKEVVVVWADPLTETPETSDATLGLEAEQVVPVGAGAGWRPGWELASSPPSPPAPEPKADLTGTLADPAVESEGPTAPASAQSVPDWPKPAVPPKVRKTVDPTYPKEAKRLNLPLVRCRAKILIDERGQPTDVHMLSCPTLFRDATRDTLMDWRFHPARDANGEAIRSQFPIIVQYSQ